MLALLCKLAYLLLLKISSSKLPVPKGAGVTVLTPDRGSYVYLNKPHVCEFKASNFEFLIAGVANISFNVVWSSLHLNITGC